MSSDRKRTRAEERELARSMARIEALEQEWKLFQILERSIPDGWRRLHERQPTTPAKTKLTLASTPTWWPGTASSAGATSRT